MKTPVRIFLCLVIFSGLSAMLYAQSVSFRTYMNPVIPGDHSDCTLTKIGNDFYTTGSSFNPTPVIYHSTDLIHWEAIAQPVSAAWTLYGDEPKGGCWGGQMVLYKGQYWDFFSRAGSMYFVTAPEPEGPWSLPVKMNNPSQLPYTLGYDNSIFIDEDSTWYLLVKNGQPNNGIVQLGNDGQPTGVVYNLSWLNPSPAHPYSWAEGPVMWKYKGWYYYSFARDVSGGQKVMRSPVLTADQSSWTSPVDFFNESDPGKPSAIFPGPNHSSAAVIIDDSTSWVLHPVWARANNNEWHGQGRQGLVNQVRYDENMNVVADYPVNAPKPAPALPSGGIPWMVPGTDFFSKEVLHPEWSFLGYTPVSTYSLTERPGWLRLRPKSPVKANTVIKTDPEHNYSLITRMESYPQSSTDEAGLRIMNGLENLAVKLYSSVNKEGRLVVCFTFDKLFYEAENLYGNKIWLKIIRENHMMSGYFSADGNTWVKAGEDINVSSLDSYSNDYNGWCGNRQGLYVKGRSADFDQYIYRDAYTPILAGCPANQYGTSGVKNISSGFSLDSIHNNDWALYAGVEFGGGDYGKASDSMIINASCVAEGSAVEVWLDSLDNGKLMAVVLPETTGSFTNFKSFAVKTQQTTGKHDVYLRFTGPGNGRLMSLRSFYFTPYFQPRILGAELVTDTTILIHLSGTVIEPSNAAGFKILRNHTDLMNVTKVFLSSDEPNTLVLVLSDKAGINDSITVNYNEGNVINAEGLNLLPAEGLYANNLLDGSPPGILSITTNEDGDSIFIFFTKKMSPPENLKGFFWINTNDTLETNPVSIQLCEADSHVYCLALENQVHYEDNILISYSGTSAISADSGILQVFHSRAVKNISGGYPPEIKSVFVRKSGTSSNVIAILFTRRLKDVTTQKNFFKLTINGRQASLLEISGAGDSIRLKFSPALTGGEWVKLSYNKGSISSVYNGILAYFTDYEVTTGPVTHSGPDSRSAATSIFLFPNPAYSQLVIQSENEIKKVRIYTTGGQLVYSEPVRQPSKNITLSLTLTKGLYLLEVSTSEGAYTSRFIIE